MRGHGIAESTVLDQTLGPLRMINENLKLFPIVYERPFKWNLIRVTSCWIHLEN